MNLIMPLFYQVAIFLIPNKAKLNYIEFMNKKLLLILPRDPSSHYLCYNLT